MSYKLLKGTIYPEEAMYVDLSSNPQKMFTLPAKTIERLGYIPPPELALIIFNLIYRTEV